RERLVAALEKRHADELLERLDLAAHRRLREEELGRGAREAEVPRGGLEPAQEIEGRQRTVGVQHAASSCTACRVFVCGAMLQSEYWPPWAHFACALLIQQGGSMNACFDSPVV